MAETTDWHAMSAREAMARLRTSARGLSDADVVERTRAHGPNALPREAPKRWWRVAVDQFASPLMMVLLAAAVVSLALGERTDAGVIVAAVLLNGVLGFAQEFKANQAMEQLRSLVQPTAVVRRGGETRVVDARAVVPGDLLVLSTGDRIVADARFVECSACETNEAPLTGESAPVAKRTEKINPGAVVAERSNMAFAGTAFVAGRGLAVVVATGAETELGKVARLVRETEERDTPLQAELARLAKWLSFGVVAIVAALFAVGLAFGRAPLEMFQTSVALAVAAIPEGLGISVTIVLAIGMQRMLRRKALVRRLVAAETLGSVSVICTDKTGTITEGHMRVDQVVGSREKVLEAMVLCNDAIVDGDEVRGTPTERALMETGLAAGLRPAELEKTQPRVGEIPFDSARKYMATLHRREGKYVLIVKGAPERVLPMCRDGEARIDEAGTLAEGGLRLIAVAHKTVGGSAQIDKELDGLTFLGFVGLRDPLRPEAAAQILAAREAGVRTIMVTGDHPKTARAIAKQAGLILRDHRGVVTGEELDRLDDDALDRALADIQVYARVEPRHKIRVVNAWQRRGDVVAVTGDGVNDAPALKAADIGVALGSGTEVAKQASDMVLLDDNLASITSAIEQGRVIFDNMRRSVVYLLTSGFTEMVLIGGALAFGLPLPLLPGQILWINLVADTLPNAALALEKGEPDIMRVPPRPRGEPVFNRSMAVLLLVIGVITDLFLFALYAWVLTVKDAASAQTFMFAAVGVASLAYVFAIRSFRRSLIRLNPFSNPWLLAAVAASLGLLVLAVHHPWLSSVLHAVPLSLSDWGLLAMIGLIKLGVIETAKRFAV